MTSRCWRPSRPTVTANPAHADAPPKHLASEAAFDAAPFQRSTDTTSRFNGADFGYDAADCMPQDYASALAKATPGDVVGLVKSDNKRVILKLEDRRQGAPVSLDEARAQIVRFRHLSEVRDVLTRLRQKTPPRLLIGPAREAASATREPASAPPAQRPGAAPATAPAVSSTHPTETTP